MPVQEATTKHSLFHDRNMQIIFSITLLAVMGVSTITPAFPAIIDTFDLTKGRIGLLITVFSLPGIFLTPVLGVLADRYGRKTILVPSLFLFAIMGTVCAFIRDFEVLLLLRFFQGAGAASLGSLNVTLVGDIYKGHLRTKAMGYNASVLSIGTAAYPAIGGALALLGWYAPFFLSILAVPVGFAVIQTLNNPEPDKIQKISEYLKKTFQSISDKKVIGLFTVNMLTFIILFGSYLTFFPLLLEENFESSAFMIGIQMSAMSISTAVTSWKLSALTRRFSNKKLLIAAYFFYTLSLVLMPYMSTEWWMFVPVVIFGFGHGINLPLILNILVGYAPMQYRAAFMSLNGMVLRIGQTLGPVVMAFVLNIWNLDGIFYAGGLTGILMLILILFLLKGKDDHKEEY